MSVLLAMKYVPASLKDLMLMRSLIVQGSLFHWRMPVVVKGNA